MCYVAPIRNPAIAADRNFASQTDAVAWLQDHLEVAFPENAEILSISLHGTEDAIGRPRLRSSMPLRRPIKTKWSTYAPAGLSSRDLLARSLENLNNEIKRKMDDSPTSLANRARLESGSGQMLQELDVKRLDRIEDEFMRLESQLAAVQKATATRT